MRLYFPQELKDFDSNNITVPDDWNDEVELKVDMVNTYDHDQDGIRSNQTAEYTFSIITSRKYLVVSSIKAIICFHI